MGTLEGRHPSTIEKLRWFTYDHLPEPLRSISALFCELAHEAVKAIPDHPQLTLALQKLLEGKDAAVRAALAAGPGEAVTQPGGSPAAPEARTKL